MVWFVVDPQAIVTNELFLKRSSLVQLTKCVKCEMKLSRVVQASP